MSMSGQEFMANAPAATLYSDDGNAHHDAAMALVERAQKQGIYSVSTGPRHEAAPSDELLNPHLALPAAYILASRIYDRMTTIASTEGAIALKSQSADEIKKMTRRLYELIDMGAMDVPVNEEGRITPLANAESLQHAVSAKQDAIMTANYPDSKLLDPYKEDFEIMLEALGQLCVEQLGRNQSTPALQTQGVAHQGRLQNREIKI